MRYGQCIPTANRAERSKGISLGSFASVMATIVAMTLGGCEPGTTSPVGVTSPGIPGGPEALAQVMRQALESGTFEDLRNCIDPAKRSQFSALEAAVEKALERSIPLIEMIERKIGPAQARRYRRLILSNALPSTFAAPLATGQIDWEMVRYVVQDDRAQALVGSAQVFTARRIGQQWYLVLGRPHIYGREFVKHRKELLREMLHVGRLSVKGLKKGIITKENFDRELDINASTQLAGAILQGTPFGPEMHGVRLCMYTTRPIRGPGAKWVFSVMATCMEGKGPICWRLPEGGLGDNIELIVDGKRIELPSVPADQLFVCVDGIQNWGFHLPASVRFSPGVHTLQYAVVSHPKEKYVDDYGERHPLLHGRIASNVLTIIVKDSGTRPAP